jgi:hypothetical protein
MRRIHFIVGLIALGTFLATGLCMRIGFHGLHGLDSATRLLFRSSHIYLLFAALLNLSLGLYEDSATGGWRAWLQRAGSSLILVAPVLFVLAFLREPWLTNLDRPFVQPAVIGSFAGMLCHLASQLHHWAYPPTDSSQPGPTAKQAPPG